MRAEITFPDKTRGTFCGWNGKDELTGLVIEMSARYRDCHGQENPKVVLLPLTGDRKPAPGCELALVADSNILRQCAQALLEIANALDIAKRTG